AADPLWAEVRRAGRNGDAGSLVDDFVNRADLDPAHARWSFHRDIGGSRLVVLDTRAGRMLDEGDRRMLDDAEMAWLEAMAVGGLDHVVVASSLPFLLPMGLHHLEAWDEAVAGGAWGARAARLAEKVRQGVDLEHWAAFQKSFQRLGRLALSLARGERGDPPATVTFLGGDVHHSYLAEAQSRTPARILQVVCSPIRNPLPRVVRFASAVAAYGLAWPMGKLAARSARVADPPFRWTLTDGPWFENVVATLDLDGRRSRVHWHTAEPPAREHGDPRLVTLRSATLS
ncbi:MAG: alkaline phosphatase family protein, partial [Actinomycetota bacterium]|nr:alkaline phosphatase family protein [Actinomycetota bacterium]